MSEDDSLKALEESEKPKPPKTIKEIRKENYDRDKIIRDLRALYESDEDYYVPKNIKSYRNGIYELPQQLLSDLRLRKLGN